MGLCANQTKQCTTLLEYVLEVDGGEKTLMHIVEKIILHNITYHWSLPKSESILKDNLKLLKQFAKELNTLRQENTLGTYGIKTMQKIYRQLKYLTGLPSDLQKQVKGSLKQTVTKLMILTEPYIHVSVKSSSASASTSSM